MVAVFLLLVLPAVVLGIIGTAADGRGHLPAIGIVLFAAYPTVVAVRPARRAGRRPVR